MTTRVVRDEIEQAALVRLIESWRPPFTANLRRGADRTVEQNKLQRLWLNEAAEQLGDMTAEEYRAYCKLHHGVPIMRAAHDEFREKYDRLIRPRSYEEKLELMAVPMDFPVTRLMTTKQKTQYLDAIANDFRGRGVVLTDPTMRG